VEDLVESSQIVYLSYNWDCDDIDEEWESELDVYSVPVVTFSNETYTNVRYDYMRNTTGSNELIRMEYINTGIRLVVRGFNTQKKLSYIVILYYIALAAICMFLLLPSIYDPIVMALHPRGREIRDTKYLNLNEKFKPIKDKNE
jgi:hypothetical protein